MDDFIILVQNREEAKELYLEIVTFLQDSLYLTLNPKSSYFPNQQGVQFLGFKIFEDHILLSRKILKSMIKRYNKGKTLYVSFYVHFKYSCFHRLKNCFLEQNALKADSFKVQ